MQIVLTGISHHTAPLKAREELNVTSEMLPEALATLDEHVGQGVIISTCNRTEVYTVSSNAERGSKDIERFIEAQFNVDIQAFRPHFYVLKQDAAVEHLFRVASGLESQILGESEVLGQVRDAFSAARKHGASGGALAHLFHSALRTGKRARTETAIGRNALSVSRACVELARRSVGALEQKHAVVIGVGEASRLAGIALRDAGVGSITIANRTPAHAVPLSLELGATLAPLENLASLLASADVVVTATAAPDFILDRELIKDASSRRGGKPLAIMDLAIPRDVDPSAGDAQGVRIYTLDDLESIAEANRRERESEVEHVEAIIEEEVQSFHSWWKGRAVTPTIAAMRHHAEHLRAEEVSKAVERMDSLSKADAERIEKMTKALVKKLLHRPTEHLRARNDESVTQSARQLFGLDE